MSNENVACSKRSAPLNGDEKLSKKLHGLHEEDIDRVNFGGVSVVEILNDNKNQKTLFLHGKLADNVNQDAVVILEKRAFDVSSDALQQILSAETKLKPEFRNDIYATYNAQLPPQHCDVKATVIYPATKKHLEKYKSQKLFIVSETEADYNNITQPFLEKQFENNVFSIQWVYNILEHKKEEERIIFEDPDPEVGFILLPDMKWNVNDITSLYVIAIPHKRGLKSLRDLTADHIPLLENMQKKTFEILEKKFNASKQELLMYFHYQPSYYHLHVHINAVALDIPGTGVLRAHLLSDVVENLKLSPNYYKHKTFSFTLRENDKLLKEFCQHNVVAVNRADQK